MAKASSKAAAKPARGAQSAGRHVGRFPRAANTAEEIRRAKTSGMRAGGGTRAIERLVPRDSAPTRQQAFRFWSAALNQQPPALRTALGNFACINSVARFTVSTDTTRNTYVWVPWTPSSVAAITMTGESTAAPGKQKYLLLDNSPPQAIRPLRMSVTLQCTTQLTSIAGSVRVLSYENPMSVRLTTGATAGVACTSQFDNDVLGLINDSPDTHELTENSLSAPLHFVSVPANYPGYNSYYDFVTLTDRASSYLTGNDAVQLSYADDQYPYPFIGSATQTTSQAKCEGGLGALPCMRGFIFLFPATTTVQTLRFACHRQDGCRYPVNTLGHAFSRTHATTDAGGEDALHNMARTVGAAPAAPVPHEDVAAEPAPGLARRVGRWVRNHLPSAGEVLGVGQAIYQHRAEMNATRQALGNIGRVARPLMALAA